MKPRDFTDFHEVKTKKFLCQSYVIVWLILVFIFFIRAHQSYFINIPRFRSDKIYDGSQRRVFSGAENDRVIGHNLDAVNCLHLV